MSDLSDSTPVTDEQILLAIAKAPASGQTKTRLGASIGLDAAAEFYACLLADTLALMRGTSHTRCGIGYTPAGREDFFKDVAPDFELVLQQGANLGERLNHVINACFSRGYQRVGVLSCDTPLVNPAEIDRGFDLVAGGIDVALGACDDGGYYLLILKEPHPELFLPIEMSTPRVVADTLAAIAKANLSVVELAMTQDIDVADDLVRLKQELHGLPGHVAQQTRKWLKQNHQ